MSETQSPLPAKSLYEVLIRFDVMGAPIAAQVQFQYPQLIDGKIKVHIGDAIPAGEHGADFPLSPALTEEIARSLEKVAPILAQMPALIVENEALKTRVAELEAARQPASDAA